MTLRELIRELEKIDTHLDKKVEIHARILDRSPEIMYLDIDKIQVNDFKIIIWCE